jgi:hypothetical protein
MLKLASILVRDLGNLGFTVQLHFRSLQLDCFDLKWEEILDHWLGQKDRGSKSVFADVDVDTGARLNSWSKKGKKNLSRSQVSVVKKWPLQKCYRKCFKKTVE